MFDGARNRTWRPRSKRTPREIDSSFMYAMRAINNTVMKLFAWVYARAWDLPRVPRPQLRSFNRQKAPNACLSVSEKAVNEPSLI